MGITEEYDKWVKFKSLKVLIKKFPKAPKISTSQIAGMFLIKNISRKNGCISVILGLDKGIEVP